MIRSLISKDIPRLVRLRNIGDNNANSRSACVKADVQVGRRLAKVLSNQKFVFRLLSSTLLLAAFCLNSGLCWGQSPLPDSPDRIHGTVINSATGEPISRALVSSPDNRFATMTDSEGHFEFTLSKEPVESGRDANSGRSAGSGRRVVTPESARPYQLTARKPGFLPEPQSQNLSDVEKEVVIRLTPEGKIVGTVTLPSTEAPDSIALQLYHREVQDGRAHWRPVGGTQSKSDGTFRIAELAAGTYKLITRELLDRDPLIFDPQGQLYGYPPVYFPNAADFSSAGLIHVGAGETVVANLSLVRQPYYRVKIAVVGATPDAGIAVNVHLAGHSGQGFSLGYNNRDQSIEGMLPNGTYAVEAAAYGATPASGQLTFTVKGSAVEGARMALAPNATIAVNVTEQFTSSEDHAEVSMMTANGRQVSVTGPRRYMQVWLEPEDEERARTASLRMPTAPDDIVIDNVMPGRYWVRISTSRGYAASIRSGNLDLAQRPLIVGAGGAASPIEIVMRDDVAEIEGTVEGLAAPAPIDASTRTTDVVEVFEGPAPSEPLPHVYCIPLPDSSGIFAEAAVAQDGKFTFSSLAPGAYRLLAFERQQPDLEYTNPEAMRAYDAKGPVIRVSARQKERTRLQLISTPETVTSE
jgi:hypothetical protein